MACGCALLSVGLPWVAQRVWPMPMVPLSGSLVQPRFEVAELALGAAARQRAALQRGDAGGIVAAIFEALERIDELPRHRLTAENSDNPAQGRLTPSPPPDAILYAPAAGFRKIKMHVRMCQIMADSWQTKLSSDSAYAFFLPGI